MSRSGERESCVINGCRTRKGERDIRLFKLPEEKEWRERMLEILVKYSDQKDKLKNHSAIFICERHFSKSCFVAKKTGRITKKEIKPGSLPSLNLNAKIVSRKDESQTESSRIGDDKSGTPSVSTKSKKENESSSETKSSNTKISSATENSSRQLVPRQNSSSPIVSTSATPAQNLPPSNKQTVKNTSNTELSSPKSKDQLNLVSLATGTSRDIQKIHQAPYSSLPTENSFADENATSKMDTWKLVSKMIMFSYLEGRFYGDNDLKYVNGMKMAQEFRSRCTEQTTIIEKLRTDASKVISEYLQRNTQASVTEQAREVKRMIDDFAVKASLVESML